MHIEYYFQMTDQEFGEKAQRLFQRLNAISLQQNNYAQYQPNLLTYSSSFPVSNASSPNPILIDNEQKLLDNEKQLPISETDEDLYSSMHPTFPSPNIASQSGQLLNQIIKSQQRVGEIKQGNQSKIRQMNDKLKKFEDLLNEQNQNRCKINENFIASALKIEKSMQLALLNVKKIYTERQKKLEEKIDSIIRNQKKRLEENIEEYNNLEQDINKLTQNVKQLQKELMRMRKNRVELQDRIFKQFSEQVRNLRAIFDKNIKQREQKQLKMLGELKRVYKNQLQNIKNEQINRQSSQRMFLSIIEQLIDKISES